jgi:hypothetical protein
MKKIPEAWVFHLHILGAVLAVLGVWFATVLYRGVEIPVAEMVIWGCVASVFYVVHLVRHGPRNAWGKLGRLFDKKLGRLFDKT